ncbi:hypothetical protein OG426_42780 [Streptomyces canus]|nr:hypothetical protein OG426_42780 [Streptomyces canus]
MTPPRDRFEETVAINFQLLGGIWILETFPALVGGLFTRWFHRWALLAGWAVGMIYGTLAAYGVASPTQPHLGGSDKEIPGIGCAGSGAISLRTTSIWRRPSRTPPRRP